ncbi:hypothetical protein [Acutalibacter sp. 1XD8-36]|uniref:hypothetical protein n=1 Tax=Acutalibacter sp. 1XD8-36 TaxID=2320852 RepID=UPI001412E672|nr:hypothetical protein [Acutalibacter sp. 1XD8-36]NBJ88707.1 hypothetical protein [Acutalibacter sp. 1XD8-36]
MKKIGIAVIALACILFGTGCLVMVGSEGKNEHEAIAVLSIESIAEKFHNNDEYYLTVALEDWLIEDFNLSYDRISFKTEQDIYDKVSPGDVYAGVTLKIRESEKCSNGDIHAVLKWERSDLCEIISLGQKAE